METPATAPTGSDTILIDSLANGTRALPWQFYVPAATLVGGQALTGSITMDSMLSLSTTGLLKRTGSNAYAIATADTDYSTPAGVETFSNKIWTPGTSSANSAFMVPFIAATSQGTAGAIDTATGYTFNPSTGQLTVPGGIIANANTSAAPPGLGGFSGTLAQELVGADGVTARDILDSFGGIFTLYFRRANGTNAAKTATLTGDNLGGFSSAGYYVTGGPAYSAAVTTVNSLSEENWTSTAHGAGLGFYTTPQGSIVLTQRMRIYGDGGISMGSAMSDPGANTFSITSTAHAFENFAPASSFNAYITNLTPGSQTIIRTSNSSAADTNALTFTGAGAAQFGSTISCATNASTAATNQLLTPATVVVTESAGTANINFALGQSFDLTLNAACTITFTNLQDGQSAILAIHNTASNYAVTWPASGMRWPPPTTAPTETTGTKTDLYTFVFNPTWGFLAVSYVQGYNN